jgi:hypothetical protein
MGFAKDHRRRLHLTGAVALASALLIAATVIGVYEENRPPPEVPPETVVQKFYEQISQAKIRGGTLLIREAYKLIDSERSNLSEARFVEIVQKYPSGFKVDVVDAEVAERHATVTVQYEVGSMFGNSFTVRNVVPVNVDEATNTWKIDFTGETDSQDLAAAKASLQ